MAARRASAQFLTIFQRSTVRSFQSVAVPRHNAAASTFSRGRSVNEDVARSTYGGFFANRQLHSESQAINDNQETHEYERTKMTSEGGGSVGSDYGEKAAEVSKRGEEVKGKVEDQASEVKSKVEGQASEVADQAKGMKSKVEDQASEAAGEAKGQVSKNVDTAKEMFSGLPEKVSETATGLKEVGVEAAKAVKRDTSKIAEKAGLKSEE